MLAFIRSSLWTKIVWWIPIFLTFLIILNGGLLPAVAVTVCLIIQAVREFTYNQGWKNQYALLYFWGFIIAIVHLGLYFFALHAAQAVIALVVVCFASVLSDVCAFFCGTYLRKNPLPIWINTNKSWEGVAGQIIGAIIGYTIIYLVTGFGNLWLLALCIGIASAIGDIANSVAKRALNIKDWGQSIPGHGGVLDRFSSLSVAIMITFWITYL